MRGPWLAGVAAIMWGIRVTRNACKFQILGVETAYFAEFFVVGLAVELAYARGYMESCLVWNGLYDYFREIFPMLLISLVGSFTGGGKSVGARMLSSMEIQASLIIG